jgi:hypothetical protein
LDWYLKLTTSSFFLGLSQREEALLAYYQEALLRRGHDNSELLDMLNTTQFNVGVQTKNYLFSRNHCENLRFGCSQNITFANIFAKINKINFCEHFCHTKLQGILQKLLEFSRKYKNSFSSQP